MDKVIKDKRSLELVNSSSSGYKTSSEKSFISYISSDQVWWRNIKRFSSYSKNYICKFMQTNSWDHKLFHFICPSESGKCGKEGKKLQKFEYLQNEKSFFDEIKNIFHSFWKFIIWRKNQNLIKNSGHKLDWQVFLPMFHHLLLKKRVIGIWFISLEARGNAFASVLFISKFSVCEHNMPCALQTNSNTGIT